MRDSEKSQAMELVSPGGSLEKIEYAYHYGADAVYVGLPYFSLRSRINEFTEKKLEKAVFLARSLDKKIYFTLNIFAHEKHLKKLEKHFKFIAKVKPDAIIISDPGIINLAKKMAPKIRIHLSTQANTTNSEAVRFWEKQGVSRIILAREVTLDEIRKIKKSCPKMELEYFVHGAMCMSYSGRCLLSSWMRSRSANLGDCVQPCRWPYQPAELEFSIFNFQFSNSKKQNYPVSENKRIILEECKQGTYIFNSQDLCLAPYLENLKKAGVKAVKIEGRTKSVYYAAATARAYRQVIDATDSKKSRKEKKEIISKTKKELEKLTNRGYWTGFLLGKNERKIYGINLKNSHDISNWQFVGQIVASKGSFNRVKVHNALKKGDKIEVMAPSGIFSDEVREIKDMNGDSAESAHGGSKSLYFVKFRKNYSQKALVRKKIG